MEDVITRISLDKNNSSLRIGETKQLKVETFPIEDVQQQFIWSSSNEEIVKVDQKGHIKALGRRKYYYRENTEWFNCKYKNHSKL